MYIYTSSINVHIIMSTYNQCGILILHSLYSTHSSISGIRYIGGGYTCLSVLHFLHRIKRCKLILFNLYDLFTWSIWIIIGMEHNISATIILIASADTSKYFEHLGVMLQQPQVVLLSDELESHISALLFSVLVIL